MRIEQTIIYALMLTFEAVPDTVINYVCILDDSQEQARIRLFNSCYFRVGVDNFIKLDHIDQETKIYASAIFRRGHHAEEQLHELFSKVFEK